MADRGSPRSRSGSTIAIRGRSDGLRRLALVRSADRTAFRVTSEPVPAVVGTATHGNGGLGERLTSANHLQVVQRVGSRCGQRGHRFGCIQSAATAVAQYSVTAGPGQSRHAGTHRVNRRFARYGEHLAPYTCF